MRYYVLSHIMKDILKSKFTRKYLLNQFDKSLYNALVKNATRNLVETQKKKYHFLSTMLKASVSNLEQGYFSEKVFRRIINVLVENAFLAKEKYKDKLEQFREEYGDYPPTFLVVSPTQACNLTCEGCYAASGTEAKPSIPYHIFDRIISEARDKLHNRFITISGGEPFIYKSEGKTLMDIIEKYNDMFFLVYTNGTLITQELAERMAGAGNVTPAISVEGFEKETDARRGEGTHRRVLQAFENLRNAGVPFGISVTATSDNAGILLDDKFYEYFFDRERAIYMWQFQLMPIGRSNKAFEKMVPPEKRVEFYRKWDEMITNEKYCVADFWNSGVLSNGCLAYGRRGGYLHIDWNGNIMPCVFVPYYVDNIYDLYNNGKTLVDALFSDFMKNGRKWIDDYGMRNPKEAKNWLMPCSIRDHYANFRENILPENAKPENEQARESLEDDNYYKNLVLYDDRLEELTGDIWEKEYLKKESTVEQNR